jgi:hypothetical protein
MLHDQIPSSVCGGSMVIGVRETYTMENGDVLEYEDVIEDEYFEISKKCSQHLEDI